MYICLCIRITWLIRVILLLSESYLKMKVTTKNAHWYVTNENGRYIFISSLTDIQPTIIILKGRGSLHCEKKKVHKYTKSNHKKHANTPEIATRSDIRKTTK